MAIPKMTKVPFFFTMALHIQNNVITNCVHFKRENEIWPKTKSNIRFFVLKGG